MSAGLRPLAAHADWSADARKRWIAIARPDKIGWTIAEPELVGNVATLLDRLRAAAAQAPVALGVDFPIGLPRAYAAALPDPDFPTFLSRLRDTPDFFRVCVSLSEITPERPFYPARGLRGMTRATHAAALGLANPAALSRACDRATAERPAGAPLFWTLGANQTGKAAIAAWRDLLIPALLVTGQIRLWPFAGPLRELLSPGVVAIAETYPAEALRQLGLRLTGSKRRQQDRMALRDALHAVMRRLGASPAPSLAALLADGFGADQAGEDRFDCVLGVLCMLNVLAGGRSDTAPEDAWVTRWEGWVLGQTALPSDHEIWADAQMPETHAAQ